jgi:hypothetical protein
MTARPLPAFLSDLAFSLAGRNLALHPMSGEPGWFWVGLAPPETEGEWGLRIHLDRQQGERTDSQTTDVFRDGRLHGHLRHLHDYVGTPTAFEAWVRDCVAKMVHQLVNRHVEGVFDAAKDAEPRERARAVERLCRDLSALGRLPETSGRSSQLLCDAHAALLGAHERGEMSDEASHTIAAFIEGSDGYAFARHIRDRTVEHACVLLPDALPASVQALLALQAQEALAGVLENAPLRPSHLANAGPFLLSRPPHLRAACHALLLPRCDTAALCVTLAMALSSDPRQAVPYLAKGLSLAPEHRLLRVVARDVVHADAFDPTLAGGAAVAAAARSLALRDENGGPSVSLAEAEALRAQYDALLPAVLYGRAEPDMGGKDQQLIALEARINRLWMALLPPRDDPSWDETVEVVCALSRLQARGSEAYVRWLRYHRRFQEGIDYFLANRVDRTQLDLRLRSDWHGDEYVAQALSCMLDTQQPEHIELALEVVEELGLDRRWGRAAVPYALACVASRAGQVALALALARQAASHGTKTSQMLRDPDFANLLADPEAGAALRALVQGEGA